MSADKKYMRSAARSCEEKSTSEESEKVAASNKKLETPTGRNGFQNDAFLSKQFFNWFADILTKKINANFEILIPYLEAKQRETDDLILSLEEENVRLKNRVDRQLQYSRRNNTRTFGVLPMKGAHTIWCRSCFPSNYRSIPAEYIDRSHRIGNHNKNKSRPPIIVKFSTYRLRSCCPGR